MSNCIILRGLPGSGKDTVAEAIVSGGVGDGVICSADDFFYEAGVYRFDKSKLGQAHEACFEHFKFMVDGNRKLVIVANTNTTRAEFKCYSDYAKEKGYMVTILTVETTLTDEELAKRNVHGVPVETIKRMRERMNAFT